MNRFSEFVAVPKIYNELTGNELKTFVVLLDLASYFANDKGVFFRSHADLMEQTGMSINTLKTSIKKLEDKNYITVTSYNDGKTNNAYNRANEYKINYTFINELCEQRRGQKLTPLTNEKESKIDSFNTEKGSKNDSKRSQKLTEKESKIDSHIRKNNKEITKEYTKEKIRKKEIESVRSDNGTSATNKQQEQTHGTKHNTSTENKKHITSKDMREQDSNTAKRINDLQNEIDTYKDIMYNTILQEVGEKAYNNLCKCMNELSAIMNVDDYKAYRKHVSNWWNATKQYLKWQRRQDQDTQIMRDKIESAWQGFEFAKDVNEAKKMLEVLVYRLEHFNGTDKNELYTKYHGKVNQLVTTSRKHNNAYLAFANGEDVETIPTERAETPQNQTQTVQVEQLPTEDEKTQNNGISEPLDDNDISNTDVNRDNRPIDEKAFNEFLALLDNE